MNSGVGGITVLLLVETLGNPGGVQTFNPPASASSVGRTGMYSHAQEKQKFEGGKTPDRMNDRVCYPVLRS